MEVILMKYVENLGFEYDIVEVKPGYARNFLIPNGMVALATPKAKKELKKKLADRAKEEEILIKNAQQIVAKLNTIKVVLKAKSGTEGKLFGSLNNQNLAEELLKLGIEIDKKQIKIAGNTIRKIGNFTAKIRLHRLVEYEYEFEVVGI